MNTEDNQENNQENDATDQPKTDEVQDEKVLAKKIKRQATQEQLDHPMHGVKLVDVLESLVEHRGWEYLAHEVNVLCFKHNPSIKVSLKFLRKFKWAREHVEDLYMDMVRSGVDPKELKKE
jgi:uncharacterized protein (DUF2132 family)